MKTWFGILGTVLCTLPVWAANPSSPPPLVPMPPKPLAPGQEWRATLSPSQPGDFPPLRPLKAVYRFGWGGVVAAQADFNLTQPKRDLYQLSMKTQTSGLVRTMWRMDSQHTATCTVSTLRPVQLHQTEAYKAKTLTVDAVFAPDAVRHTTQVTPAKGPPPPPESERRFKFGNVFDLQSALLFIRSQKLASGDHYRIVVFPARDAYLADIDVVGREKVKVPAGSYDAIKCKLSLQEIDKHLLLAPHKKFKHAYAWISDDKDRLMIKIQSEIFVGSVWCELQSVEFPP